MEILTRHEAEVLGNMIEVEMRGYLLQVFQPGLLFRRPPPREHRKENTVTYEPVLFTICRKQIGKPPRYFPLIIKGIKRPLDSLHPLFGKQREGHRDNISIEITS